MRAHANESADSEAANTAKFLSLVLANPWNAAILEYFPRLHIADWWLTAGCVAQSVWNGLYGHAPEYGILDYDIFYFDADTSWEAEDAAIRQAGLLFADLPVAVQLRNQARVPLWYREKFGVPFGAVNAASDGIDRFPCRTMSVGVRRRDGAFTVHAPFGLSALLNGVLIPNATLPVPEVYAQKARRWMTVWPQLNMLPWPERDACGGA